MLWIQLSGSWTSARLAYEGFRSKVEPTYVGYIPLKQSGHPHQPGPFRLLPVSSCVWPVEFARQMRRMAWNTSTCDCVRGQELVRMCLPKVSILDQSKSMSARSGNPIIRPEKSNTLLQHLRTINIKVGVTLTFKACRTSPESASLETRSKKLNPLQWAKAMTVILTIHLLECSVKAPGGLSSRSSVRQNQPVSLFFASGALFFRDNTHFQFRFSATRCHLVEGWGSKIFPFPPFPFGKCH